MNSIDRAQEENNVADLSGQDAIEKIIELSGKAGTCFFCTNGGARPMTVLKADEQGSLWFLCASDSHCCMQVEQDGEVDLYFQGSPHSDFMHLKGMANATKDDDKIRELWSPLFKTWFTEGIEDTRIRVIEFKTNQGFYWDNKHGNFVSAVKILIGAAIGKTMDDSISGNLNV